MHFYIRTALDPAQALGSLGPVIARIDPNLPIENPRTLPRAIRDNTAVDRMISILSATFAAVATLLAAIGLYGVLAYTVSQRTREFGLRMALGAAPERVRGIVLRQVGWMTLIGGAIGLAAAMAMGRFAESLLFQLKGRDPIVFALGIVVLTVVAFGAGFMPDRASRVDPMRALRYE
jgi:ABC-type antimicrobial peptide transport system permease subunit